MSGRGGIYEGPDGSKLHGDGREVKAMSQTDKERATRLIWDSAFNEEGDELGPNHLESAYDAGYRAAREDAAQIAEHPYRLGEVDGESKPPEVGKAVAAAIRKLEPNP